MLMTPNRHAVHDGASPLLLSFRASPLLTADGPETGQGTAASSLREVVVIGGSARTAVSISATVDDPE